MDFPIPPEFWWSTDILLIINPSTGMDQEIHPCGQGRINSVKIKPSLLRMIHPCVVHNVYATTQGGVYQSVLSLLNKGESNITH